MVKWYYFWVLVFIMFLLFIVLAADKHTPQLSGRVEERCCNKGGKRWAGEDSVVGHS
jgi:hypothetical protein